MKLCGRVLKRPYLRRWSSIKGFLTRWVTSGGRMVAKRALEQRYLLEATSTSYLTSLLMHHHVLSEPPLHAGQHFDEVLLRQTTSFWNLHDCISTLGTLTSKMSHCLPSTFLGIFEDYIGLCSLPLLHHYHLIHCIRCFVTLCTKALPLPTLLSESLSFQLESLLSQATEGKDIFQKVWV